MACKIMTGQKINDMDTLSTNPNMSLLHQQVQRKRKEKPSGRKAPRKGDFNQVHDDEGYTLYMYMYMLQVHRVDHFFQSYFAKKSTLQKKLVLKIHQQSGFLSQIVHFMLVGSTHLIWWEFTALGWVYVTHG